MPRKATLAMNTCKTCAHFYQHYIKSEDGYKEVYCGHCVHPRIKRRAADQTCEKWTAHRG